MKRNNCYFIVLGLLCFLVSAVMSLVLYSERKEKPNRKKEKKKSGAVNMVLARFNWLDMIVAVHATWWLPKNLGLIYKQMGNLHQRFTGSH